VLPIAIDREGVWHAQDLRRLRQSTHKALPIDATGVRDMPALSYEMQGKRLSTQGYVMK